jgi:hypothetical protein
MNSGQLTADADVVPNRILVTSAADAADRAKPNTINAPHAAADIRRLVMTRSSSSILSK